MGKDIKVIEFYGVPGSGKSTISHEIYCELKQKGIDCCEPTYHIDHNLKPVIRKLYKFLNLSRLFLFHHNVYTMAKKMVNQNQLSAHDKRHNLFNISSKIYLVIKNIKKKDIIFLDEGLLQSCISMSNTVEALNNNIGCFLEIYSLFTVNPSFVYIASNIETIVEHLSIRKTNDSKIEKISDNSKRREEIIKLVSLCESVSISSCFRWDTNMGDNVKFMKGFYSFIGLM